jgi:hypothetical protein
MNKLISPKITALTFGVLVISFGVAFYAVAWQEPTVSPPGDNVATPLNVDSEGQSKQGWLHTFKSLFTGDAPSTAEQESTGILRTTGGAILNTGGAVTGLIIDKGEICIGTECRDSWPETNEGDITAVNAGIALTGGGSSGDVILNLGTNVKETPYAPRGGLTIHANDCASFSENWALCPSGQYVCGVRLLGVDHYNYCHNISVQVRCCGE